MKALDLEKKASRYSILGVVQGFLDKKDNSKGRISLKAQSCQLLAFIAPFDTPFDIPTNMGAEDKLALRIDPSNLGFPVRVYRDLENMSGVTMDKVRALNKYGEVWNENEIQE